ncbi:alpha/beta fold hydrolase [Altererythrobacter sp. BO-6]|uniref:alpha/beta fold hydrolase n=1 Tax=Altererythrobacter sp. BO-6 TaxID=2604537 RepID=UPI0013E1F4E5|nr:alpha/beta hydrolase [Altererythrobacter sp. BO-6]QIG54023.1 alpha/beta fold hydrolase [Altererythrobacter sp. BO-6]
MAEAEANGITLHYDTHGDPSDPPMLLVMGLGAQMTLWPIDLVKALAGHGFHVIRYDNRDIGLSQKMEGAKAPGILRMVIFDRLGLPLRSPYSLADMARDGIGLLDALRIERAHVVGASMGGMIAQHMAMSHPAKVASLTSIFSSTGHRSLARSRAHAVRALTRRPRSMEEDALVAHGMNIARAIGSPAYRADEEELRRRVTENVRRSVYPAGFVRQLAAILADGSRRERLASVTAPTLVLHGEDDPLVPVDHGHDTARHVSGAKLKTYPGWGHDLPVEMVETLARDIAEHARAAA